MELQPSPPIAPPSIVDCAVSVAPIAGEIVAGDEARIILDGPRALLVVADGSGHGKGAAVAAQAIVEELAKDWRMPLDELARVVHERLSPSRGAALALVAIDGQTRSLQWLGVGDVDAVLFRAAEVGRSRPRALIPKAGIVGYRLPGRINPETLALSAGDLIIVTTDGVDTLFRTAVPGLHGLEPQEIATELLMKFGKRTDDALVLVARYRGLP